MKHLNTKLYVTAIFIFLNFRMFATPGEDTPEDQEASINTQLLWLLIAGVAFAFYYFYTQRKKQVN